MRDDIRLALEASHFFRGQCDYCHCPTLKFEGDTDLGIVRVRCPECGENAERMEPLDAVAWWLRSAATCIRSGDLELADAHMESAKRAWLKPSIGRPGGFVWIVTTDGSGDLDNDETPF